MDEQLPLAAVGEAVELHRVLADVEVRLDRDLVGGLALPDGRGSGMNEVADTSHIEHEALGRVGSGLAAQTGDHAVSVRTGTDVPSARGHPEQGRRKRVTNRHGESVGSVVRRWQLLEAEEHLHHPLHLRLLGTAVAADRLLDAGGRILAAGDSRVGGRDEHGAACLADEERDAGVAADVRLLDRHRIRRVLGNERCDGVVDRLQTDDRVLAGRCRPAAVGHFPEAASAFLDDSVPASSSPRIDAYYLHDRKLRPRSDESCSEGGRIHNRSGTEFSSKRTLAQATVRRRRDMQALNR